MTIRVMTIADYPAVYALWESLPGIGLHGHEDSLEGMAYYLRRNPESCFVAEEGNAIIGAILCGNDGRRGYINHLAVAQEHQGQGLGRALVDACLAAMRNEGILKCSFVTFRGNEAGNAFWDAIGSARRDDCLYRNLKTGESS
ncbi:MAG: GNAT family N-acetyltransferase [Oscillospiraceae bacterium]|jgi:ribosomal protein S18 acetylase RimI-like enzyme|nr:GNAT family N-acetyltransferase [Oscillospiraceae bacterium]